MREIQIKKNDAGQRLDRFVAKALPLLPPALAQKYIRLKRIKVNGRGSARDVRLVEGVVKNSADVLELSLVTRTTLDCSCDRCAKPFRREKEISYDCVLAEEKQNEDNEDIVLLEQGEFVDAEDLARTAFILGMDTKTLCSEECKGLCPRCGADLNLGPCSCKKDVDPRLAALAKLLEQQ